MAVDVTRLRPAKPLRPLTMFLAGIVLLPVVLLIGAFAAAVSVTPGDVDRTAYTRTNRALLDQLPILPGARLVSVEEQPVRYADDLCCGSPITGYITEATFESAPGTTADDVTRYYQRVLPPLGWRESSRGKYAAGWPRILKSKRNVLNVSYQRGDASLGVDLIPFIRGNRIVHGGRFVISIDHGGFRPA